jgi:hypothetical protein
MYFTHKRKNKKDMTNLKIIKKLKESIFTDEDGEDYQLEFQPGLNDSQIEELNEKLPGRNIDSELLEIVKETKGWDGFGLDMVYFDSIGDFGFTELSENSLSLGNDGFGNSWILDLMNDGSLGKVYYACHDPAVLVVHSQTLNEYLLTLLEFYENPDNCYLNQIHDVVVNDVWEKNDLCSSKLDFETANKGFEEFLAKHEGDEWIVADLRNGQNKDGFAWGKFGPNQLTERHPSELLWLMKSKVQKKGFLSRLLGI